MKELGEYLRQVRTEKNISLNDIQEATKIRKHYLEAIENGDFEAIPGEVYRKGFLVNYANAIGLDGQEILARYNQSKEKTNVLPAESGAKREPEAVSKPESSKQQQQDHVTRKSNTRIRLKNSTNLWIFAAIIVVIVAAWALIPVIKERTLKLNQAPEVETSSAPRATLPTAKPERSISSETEVSTEDTEASTDSETVSTQIYPAPITVYAEFSEDVWVQVIADGKPFFMEDGQTFHADSPKQVWTAQKELTINIGNSGGIRINFNGTDLGKIGQHGIRKTITFTPEGLVNQN